MPPTKFDARAVLTLGNKSYTIFRLDRIPGLSAGQLARLPFSIRILLESVLRHYEHGPALEQDIDNLAHWTAVEAERKPMPFFAGRVILQDFTGVPVMNDLASMRSALARMGCPPEQINPIVPVDLVIDHSVQVDYYASAQAYQLNAEMEFARNRERYEFLHWCQKVFNNLHVVPPASGIVHQVNLEYLASLVLTNEQDGETLAYPDTLVGTDSHTTMINGLGVVGWGVGGIEAVAAMLGEPIEILTPEVIGLRLSGRLPEGTTPTDLTLTVTNLLRKHGVVDKFIECYGPGLDTLTLADRAMVANMTPETGATMIYFPVDDRTLEYLRFSGRSAGLVELVEAYYKTQHIFRDASTPDPEFSTVLELDMSTIEPGLAGPKRPQDRVLLTQVKDNFHKVLAAPVAENGYGIQPSELSKRVLVQTNGSKSEIGHGSVVIAAITSCTNTSNPFVMMSAGLLAKKAVEKGLRVKPFVKTSLAPGSRVVTEYLRQAGLMEPLEQLGFNLVGYGCTTCIGNSGPLSDPMIAGIKEGNLVVGAVLSGNRNFEGRVSPQTRANYLASPPLVVAYALAGTLDIDLTREPLGTGQDGQPVYLKDIWPSSQETLEVISKNIQPAMFDSSYSNLYSGNAEWNLINSGDNPMYQWSPESTYLQDPPFFEHITTHSQQVHDIRATRVLVMVGNSITTDHISPAGSIPVNSPAGKYLIEHGVQPKDFNSFGSRRGNDRVMTRGTYGNIRLKNLLVPGVEGSYTVHLPDGEQMFIYDAAVKYQAEGIPLVVLAGKEYGTGSSRDWAAKGVLLLGVRVVIAESFERIHRSNLAGMGVLPLQYKAGDSAASLGLSGREVFYIENLEEHLVPGAEIMVRAVCEDGSQLRFPAILRLDTQTEVQYYRNGGILNTILYKLCK